MDLIKFTPIYKPTLWGGNRIHMYKGFPTLPEQIGESWELCAMEGNNAVVAEGRYKGIHYPTWRKD